MTWQDLGNGVSLYTYANKFAGKANAYAVDIGGGRIAVVSPSQNTPAEIFAAVEARGTVAALIAPGGHDLGQPEWQARYPAAETFAPTNQIAALAKKKTLRPFRPISELKVDRKDVAFVDVPGSKSGSVFFRAGTTAYVDEILGNHDALPPNIPFKIIFALTKSSPGLRPNNFYGMMFCSDKHAVARSMLEKLDGVDVIGFAHGEPIRAPRIDTAKGLLSAL